MATLAQRRLLELEEMAAADAAGGGSKKMAAKASGDEGATRMARDAAIGHVETQRGLSAKGFSDAELKKLHRDAGAYDK